MTVKYMDVSEFRQLGLVQEINRRILHPIGLALVVSVDEKGNEIISGILDARQDSEGIRFADHEIDSVKAKNYDEMLKAKSVTRSKALGYTVQPVK